MIIRSLLVLSFFIATFSVSAFAEQESLRQSVVGANQDPIFINSDTLSANNEKRVFTYSGNVELRRGDVFVTSDRLLGFYDVENRIETVIFESNVVITRGESTRASSERAEYDVKSEIIELTENPELAQDGNVLTADKVLLYVVENRSEAVGNVRVKLIRDEAAKVSLGTLGERSGE